MARPFPEHEIRDALGLVRLLYMARAARGGASPSEDPLVAIGRELRAALAHAREPEGSPGYRAGVERAARALDRLAGAVTLRDDLGDAARAGEARITGKVLKKPGKGGR